MKERLYSGMILGEAILSLLFLTSTMAGAQTPPPVSPGTTNAVTPATLPPDIDPNSPVGQVVRMLQAGVDESVIMAYIGNLSVPFNINSSEIVYLNDLGAPGELVTAMIQHDQQLGVAVNPQPSEAPPEEAQQGPEATEDTFYGALAPYGSWVNIPGYGVCWQPCATIYNPGWWPYCSQGQWVYTDCGWYWMSNYSWGWCVFHYGRWFHHARWGWCWWPDTLWAPSWVCWRDSGNYCGWAPLPPHCYYRQGLGLFFNGAVIGPGFDSGIGADLYTFVPMQHFADPHPDRYRPGSAERAEIFSRSEVLNDITASGGVIVNNGIAVSRISAAEGRALTPLPVRAATAIAAPGGRGEQVQQNGHVLVVDRPIFDARAPANLNNGIRPAPAPGQWVANRPAPLIIYGNGNNTRSRTYIPLNYYNNYAGPQTLQPGTSQAQNAGNIPTPASGYWSMPDVTPAPAYNNEPQYKSPRLEERTPREAPPEAQEPPQVVEPRPEETRPAQPPAQIAPARVVPLAPATVNPGR